MVPRIARRGGFVILFGLAAYLRLGHIDLAEFRREEAWNALAALDLVAGRHLPLVGMGTSLTGLENGPLLIYLLAIPLSLARDAALASAFIALLNLGAVALTARLVYLAAGPTPALLTTLTYAVGSWAVYFSRKIWPNDPLPLFSALLALALYQAIVADRRRWLLAAGVALGGLANLHPSGFTLGPVAILALGLRPRLVRSAWLWIGGLAAVAISLPFLVHEVGSGWPGLRALRGAAGQTATLDLSALPLALSLVRTDGYATVLGGAADLYEARALLGDGLNSLLPGLVLLGVGATAADLVRHWLRGGEWRAPALLLVWLVIPIAIATRRTVPLWNHYFIVLMPALFVFLGLGLATLLRLGGRRPTLRWGSASLVLASALWLTAVQVQGFELFFSILRTDGERTIYGAPVAFQRAAAEAARDRAAGRPIVLVSKPAAWGLDDLVPVWRFLIPDAIELRFDDSGAVTRLTEHEALYVVAPTADRVVGRMLDQRGTPVGAPVYLPGQPIGYEYWRAAAGHDAAELGRLSGLHLNQVSLPRTIAARDEIPIQAIWRVDGPLPAESLALFVHLVDDRGTRLAGMDRAGIPGADLRVGDELLSWVALPAPGDLPVGRYWIATGFYRAAGVQRLPRLDSQGRQVGDDLRLGPLKVAPAPPPETGLAPLASFADGITLESVALGAEQPPTIDLIWRATGRPTQDYTVFVHLLDSTGQLVAQHDGVPREGTYPTSVWDAGERLLDRHRVDVPPGRYELRVGLYDRRGTRLRFPGGDAVAAGSITVR